MRPRVFTALLLVGLLLTALALPAAAGGPARKTAPGGQPKGVPFRQPPMSSTWDAFRAFQTEVAESDGAGVPGITQVERFTCAAGADTDPAGNLILNCFPGNGPRNETTIAVDPHNPNVIIGGTNAYNLIRKGATVVARLLMDFYISKDGGSTWLAGTVPGGAFADTGDPAVAFDSRGRAYFAALAFHTGQGGGFANASIQVSYLDTTASAVAWSTPALVAAGTGGTGVTLFNDKEYIAADHYTGSPYRDRVYVTWTEFRFGPLGGYLGSPIMVSYSDDGVNWSAPRKISGTGSALCPDGYGVVPAGNCDISQFSVPAVGPDGTVYVAFLNWNNGAADGSGQYLVVKSADGGATWSAPMFVADVQDGYYNYPFNADCRQTLGTSQFRWSAGGNIAVGPAGELYVVWSDSRHGSQNTTWDGACGFTSGPPPATNADVFIASSTDGGATWTAPAVVAADQSLNDQFYPWVAVAPDGTVNVTYMDRQYDSANSQYGQTLARLAPGGSWTAAQVSTALSDPDHSRWFSAATGGKTLFLGDYNGLAVDSTGKAWPLWTDMRRTITFGTRSGTTEDAVTVGVDPAS